MLLLLLNFLITFLALIWLGLCWLQLPRPPGPQSLTDHVEQVRLSLYLPPLRLNTAGGNKVLNDEPIDRRGQVTAGRLSDWLRPSGELENTCTSSSDSSRQSSGEEGGEEGRNFPRVVVMSLEHNYHHQENTELITPSKEKTISPSREVTDTHNILFNILFCILRYVRYLPLY